jgi:anti-sigma factor RsiW
VSALKGEREVAGLRCGAVLAGLTEYLEGGLAPEMRQRVEAHVAGCDRCERFGGAFGAAVRAIRAASAEPAPPDVLGRLEARLSRG